MKKKDCNSGTSQGHAHPADTAVELYDTDIRLKIKQQHRTVNFRSQFRIIKGMAQFYRNLNLQPLVVNAKLDTIVALCFSICVTNRYLKLTYDRRYSRKMGSTYPATK